MQSINTSYYRYKRYSDNPVSISTYRNIAGSFMKFIMQKVFDGETISFPYKLGSLKIKGKKPNVVVDDQGNINLPTDWKATVDNKYEKRLVHFNSHSNGVIYKFLWSKKKCLIQHKSLFSLKITKGNKRTLCDKIKIEKKEYIIE